MCGEEFPRRGRDDAASDYQRPLTEGSQLWFGGEAQMAVMCGEGALGGGGEEGRSVAGR